MSKDKSRFRRVSFADDAEGGIPLQEFKESDLMSEQTIMSELQRQISAIGESFSEFQNEVQHSNKKCCCGYRVLTVLLFLLMMLLIVVNYIFSFFLFGKMYSDVVQNDESS